MKKSPSLLICALAVIAGVNLMCPHSILAEDKGFTFKEIRFDESMGYPAKPTPTIPKGWRFVGVSNGEKLNCNNLWFQDKEGNIYLVRGFNSYDKFVLLEEIHKLKVGK